MHTMARCEAPETHSHIDITATKENFLLSVLLGKEMQNGSGVVTRVGLLPACRPDLVNDLHWVLFQVSASSALVGELSS